MAEFTLIVVAYLLGSTPFGYVLAKSCCGIDPRQAGSRSIGATNVARLCGFPMGVATLACDLLKGFLPVWAALVLNNDAVFITMVAMAAVLGHVFSCFLGLKGGKAVATSIGVFIPIAFCPLLVSAFLCVLAIWRSGFVSLGSLILVTAMPVLLLFSGSWRFIPLSLLVMALVFWSHRANILRLVRGQEKTWLKKSYKE